MTNKIRHLIIVLGDQLDEFATIFDTFDPLQDVIFMAEVLEESTAYICKWMNENPLTFVKSANKV